MLLKLLVLFIVLPLLDLWLLFTLADGVLSFGATVGLVLATGVIGASLAKQQGLMESECSINSLRCLNSQLYPYIHTQIYTVEGVCR